MARGQRFDVVDVQGGAAEPAFGQSADQGVLVDKGSAGGVDQYACRPQEAEFVLADDSAGAFRKPHVHRHHVRVPEECVLADFPGTGLRGCLVGEVGAPGDDVHPEGPAVGGDPGPDFAQAQHPQGLAGQLKADGGLPAAGAQASVFERNAAGERKQQGPGQFRGGCRRTSGSAHQ